jgi:hypothetical protein
MELVADTGKRKLARGRQRRKREWGQYQAEDDQWDIVLLLEVEETDACENERVRRADVGRKGEREREREEGTEAGKDDSLADEAEQAEELT